MIALKAVSSRTNASTRLECATQPACIEPFVSGASLFIDESSHLGQIQSRGSDAHIAAAASYVIVGFVMPAPMNVSIVDVNAGTVVLAAL